MSLDLEQSATAVNVCAKKELPVDKPDREYGHGENRSDVLQEQNHLQ